jgi:HlyD family secretion protein
MKVPKIVPVLVLASAGAAWWYFSRPEPLPEGTVATSGTVEATDAQLGFQVPGRLLSLGPREGDRVEAGAELARLDTTEVEARKAQAEAQVEVAKAQLAEVEAGPRREEVASAKAAVTAAEQRVADARRDAERARALLAGKAISREALDKAELALSLAETQREQALEGLRLVEKGARAERRAAARAAARSAEAAIKTSDALLGQLRLEAPFGGVVTVRHREAGEVVPAGSPVLTLMNPDDRWVRIYVPENQLGKVALGQDAKISSDTFPGKVYRGKVAFIASEAEFTPKNVQTTEERVRLVYAVKVRIEGDPEQELKPGLPADVSLEKAGAGSAP